MPLDAFLVFQGTGASAPEIEGETKDKVMKEKKAFDISNWSFAITQDVSVGSATGGIGAGKVTFEQFKVTKSIDKASPLFFHTLCTGGHYKDAVLMIRKAGAKAGASGDIYLRFSFKLVFVANVSWSHNDPSPTEDITFDYGALQVEYFKQMPDGTLGPAQTTAWSRVLNNNTFDIGGA